MMTRLSIVFVLAAVFLALPKGATKAETVLPQNYGDHIKDARICGPLTLSDKTGSVLFSLGEGQCMALNWKPQTSMPVAQTPLPNIKD
jgi:hypothetical protein